MRPMIDRIVDALTWLLVGSTGGVFALVLLEIYGPPDSLLVRGMWVCLAGLWLVTFSAILYVMIDDFRWHRRAIEALDARTTARARDHGGAPSV